MEEGPKRFNFPLVEGKLSEMQLEQFYGKMKDVVVNVEIHAKFPDTDHFVYDCEGAGVFISPKGHVLTLLGVLLDPEGHISKKIRVITNKGNTYQMKVMSAREDLGLAVLGLGEEVYPIEFPYASICTDELKIGEEVYPIGHPGYLDFSFPVGHISFPCREYDELSKSLSNDLMEWDLLKDRLNSRCGDVGARFICHVDDLSCLSGLSGSTCFVMVNNVHGGGRDGSMGMPFFNNRGEIIGMYFLLAYDQCYGIHAKTLSSMMSGIEI
ncbi:hypothetical protein TSUD_70320 [Trifolium subterraneum]|uniref:Peptidase S1 domain-containing protein n=1 Tax=Trifolium subterraneum TaxID=3900 RepID=A0A2Z6N1Y6_TRISU|nr:hypothetical protein TSUD_70320 [Trifolium subterraneum]